MELYNFGDFLARISGFRDWQEKIFLEHFYIFKAKMLLVAKGRFELPTFGL